MADNIETITFTSVSLDTLGIGGLPLTTYSGTLSVDYTTGTVTGTLTVAPALGISLTSYSTFTLTAGAGNTYTINGTGQTAGLVASTISIQYTGSAPTSVATQYSVAGVELAAGTNGAVTSTPAPCFASGTLIRTSRGEVAVENLAVGDLAVTGSGALRPIKWIGHRAIDCRNHGRPRETLPIRIAANAFGENRPTSDLYLSPGHSICVEVGGEVLIPASSLVNGSTIAQVEVETVVYWHVELDSHDILVANGLPTESYLEMTNRAFFVENDVVALEVSPDPIARTHDDFCRPFHASGALVDAVHARLSARAAALGRRRLDLAGLAQAPLVASAVAA